MQAPAGRTDFGAASHHQLAYSLSSTTLNSCSIFYSMGTRYHAGLVAVPLEGTGDSISMAPSLQMDTVAKAGGGGGASAERVGQCLGEQWDEAVLELQLWRATDPERTSTHETCRMSCAQQNRGWAIQCYGRKNPFPIVGLDVLDLLKILSFSPLSPFWCGHTYPMPDSQLYFGSTELVRFPCSQLESTLPQGLNLPPV